MAEKELRKVSVKVSVRRAPTKGKTTNYRVPHGVVLQVAKAPGEEGEAHECEYPEDTRHSNIVGYDRNCKTD